ncbi:Cyst_wall protein [Hexamita inflata]|uniref:Cyst wall protein n=1 Tax=Hexamita inflata TaxID=28002 RepID=A0AA86UFY1_9EUKA|nr:Cyst wall protein [Hexamita inflata]
MLSIALAFANALPKERPHGHLQYNGGILWTGAGLLGYRSSRLLMQGVTCQNSVVVGLDLSGFGLTGILTPDIQCLKFLKSLHLNNNSLASEIPTALCALQNLQYFQANSAGFTGVIPACVCTMQHIMYFYVDNNTLSGQIPTCVGNMTYLREMAEMQLSQRNHPNWLRHPCLPHRLRQTATQASTAPAPSPPSLTSSSSAVISTAKIASFLATAARSTSTFQTAQDMSQSLE